MFKTIQTIAALGRSYSEYYNQVGLDFDLCWWGVSNCIPKGVLYGASIAYHVANFIAYKINN